MTPASVTSISAGTAHLFARAPARRRTRAGSTLQSRCARTTNYDRRSPSPPPTAPCPRVCIALRAAASAHQNACSRFNPHRTRRSGYAV